MHVPTEWLAEYVDCDLSPEALAEALIRLGIGVEAIHPAPDGLGGAVLETEITPNRGDCLSITGVAREIAALLGTSRRRPTPRPAESPTESIAGRCAVRIDEPDLCPRYSARLVLGAQHGPSPEWMRRRLIACGQRPIDIFVDVTNYVLFELGQPLHAFDYDLLGETIVVRRAAEGELFITLDGVKRMLSSRHLLITDGERGVALGGVMGGQNTAVTAQTTNILLEAAHFQAPLIRRTARELGLESESSYRFARTVDPELTVVALDRCAELLAEYAGATIAQGVVDVVAKPIEPARISLRPARCNQVLGTGLDATTMAGYLEALELDVASIDGRLDVTVPTFRPDLTREVDLIEEIARRHGYDKIPVTVPRASDRVGRPGPRLRLERSVRELLVGFGLSEVQTFSLTCPAAMARATFDEDPAGIGAVCLQNALNEEYSVLRWSLLPSMLEVVGRNESAHGAPARLFELGRTYRDLDRAVSDEQAAAAGRVATGRTATTLPEPCVERRTLAIAVTGASWAGGWNLTAEQEALDFFELKGILDALFEELRLPQPTVESHEQSLFIPGRAAAYHVAGRTVAVLGEVRGEVTERYDIRRPLLLLEADFGWMLESADTRRTYQPLPRFPAALRDLAWTVPDEVPAAQLAATIGAAGGALLANLELFDVYRGKGLDAGHRSLAYRLTFRDAARTLTDAEVDEVIAGVVAAVGRDCRARLRE